MRLIAYTVYAYIKTAFLPTLLFLFGGYGKISHNKPNTSLL